MIHVIINNPTVKKQPFFAVLLIIALMKYA